MQSSKFTQVLPKIERFKILFQYALMVLCSCVVGVLFHSFLGSDYLLGIYSAIEDHFNSLALYCDTLTKAAVAIVKYSSAEIISVLLIFISSFAVFNYVACDVILIYNAFRFAFSATLLLSAVHSPWADIGISSLEAVSFAISRLAIILVLLIYSYYSAVYSCALRVQKENGRSSFKYRHIASYFLVTLSYVGSLLIINAFYLLFIYFL